MWECVCFAGRARMRRQRMQKVARVKIFRENETVREWRRTKVGNVL